MTVPNRIKASILNGSVTSALFRRAIDNFAVVSLCLTIPIVTIIFRYERIAIEKLQAITVY